MHRLNGIFHGLVKNENTMTELLCNLFAYQPFRKLMLSEILKNNPKIKDFQNLDVTYEDIGTQLVTDFGIPDLVINNSKIILLIENKVNRATVLTENQSKGYHQYLNKKEFENRVKHLCFIVPKDYARSQLDERIDSLNSESKITTSVILWNVIIALIKNNELDRINPYFKDFLQVLENWFMPEKIYFSSEEVSTMFKANSDIPKIIGKIFKVVDGVCLPDYPKEKRNISISSGEYGIVFHNEDDKDVLFFGIWLEYWEQYGSPLSYGVWNKWEKEVVDIVDKFKSLIPKDKLHEIHGKKPGEIWYASHFDIVDYENGEIIKEIKEKLGDVLSKLQ